MSGLTLEKMVEWHYILKNKLLSATNYMGCHTIIINPIDYYNFENEEYQSYIEVEEFNLAHVISSDIVIANLEGLSSSDETKIELHDANYHNKIPVIVFGKEELYENLHPWVKQDITRVEKDMDGVVRYIQKFYMA